MKKHFIKYGFSKHNSLIDIKSVNQLKIFYNKILDDHENTLHLRSDLGGSEKTGSEKITQIMRPSLVIPELKNSSAYSNALNYSKYLLGDDMDLDFDMLINKSPNTNTPTPWHQDAAYWIDMPDKRSVSCWIALDKAYKENGCMWFIPRKNRIIKTHKPIINGGALSCKADINNANFIELNEGDCTFHDGYTLHFSKGNTTSNNRRALILNFRPKKMILFERSRGINHIGKRKVRNK
jgi:ectoine hydroxylase-related dioxygenase (phytanoyl-CoA dioxygenase family)